MMARHSSTATRGLRSVKPLLKRLRPRRKPGQSTPACYGTAGRSGNNSGVCASKRCRTRATRLEQYRALNNELTQEVAALRVSERTNREFQTMFDRFTLKFAQSVPRVKILKKRLEQSYDTLQELEEMVNCFSNADRLRAFLLSEESFNFGRLPRVSDTGDGEMPVSPLVRDAPTREHRRFDEDGEIYTIVEDDVAGNGSASSSVRGERHSSQTRVLPTGDIESDENADDDDEDDQQQSSVDDSDKMVDTDDEVEEDDDEGGDDNAGEDHGGHHDKGHDVGVVQPDGLVSHAAEVGGALSVSSSSSSSGSSLLRVPPSAKGVDFVHRHSRGRRSSVVLPPPPAFLEVSQQDQQQQQRRSRNSARLTRGAASGSDQAAGLGCRRTSSLAGDKATQLDDATHKNDKKSTASSSARHSANSQSQIDGDHYHHSEEFPSRLSESDSMEQTAPINSTILGRPKPVETLFDTSSTSSATGSTVTPPGRRMRQGRRSRQPATDSMSILSDSVEIPGKSDHEFTEFAGSPFITESPAIVPIPTEAVRERSPTAINVAQIWAAARDGVPAADRSPTCTNIGALWKETLQKAVPSTRAEGSAVLAPLATTFVAPTLPLSTIESCSSESALSPRPTDGYKPPYAYGSPQGNTLHLPRIPAFPTSTPAENKLLGGQDCAGPSSPRLSIIMPPPPQPPPPPAASARGRTGDLSSAVSAQTPQAGGDPAAIIAVDKRPRKRRAAIQPRLSPERNSQGHSPPMAAGVALPSRSPWKSAIRTAVNGVQGNFAGQPSALRKSVRFSSIQNQTYVQSGRVCPNGEDSHDDDDSTLKSSSTTSSSPQAPPPSSLPPPPPRAPKTSHFSEATGRSAAASAESSASSSARGNSSLVAVVSSPLVKGPRALASKGSRRRQQLADAAAANNGGGSTGDSGATHSEDSENVTNHANVRRARKLVNYCEMSPGQPLPTVPTIVAEKPPDDDTLATRALGRKPRGTYTVARHDPPKEEENGTDRLQVPHQLRQKQQQQQNDGHQSGDTREKGHRASDNHNVVDTATFLIGPSGAKGESPLAKRSRCQLQPDLMSDGHTTTNGPSSESSSAKPKNISLAARNGALSRRVTTPTEDHSVQGSGAADRSHNASGTSRSSLVSRMSSMSDSLETSRGRTSRRASASVNYAEPSLRAKIRRN